MLPISSQVQLQEKTVEGRIRWANLVVLEKTLARKSCLPEPEIHLQGMRMKKEELDKFCLVHILSQEIKPRKQIEFSVKKKKTPSELSYISEGKEQKTFPSGRNLCTF